MGKGRGKRMILPVAKRWGGGPRPEGVVEGPGRCVMAPPSALRTATSPWLRHREDCRSARPTHLVAVLADARGALGAEVALAVGVLAALTRALTVIPLALLALGVDRVADRTALVTLLLGAVRIALETFAAGDEAKDDQTLLVVKVL